MPPLRERVEDIQPLTDGFLQEISTQLKISIPQYDADFLNYLKGQPWQGNVRELYNVLYRACSLAKNDQLDIESLNLNPYKVRSFLRMILVSKRWMRSWDNMRRVYCVFFMPSIQVRENWHKD